jgi:hypothetical protein
MGGESGGVLRSTLSAPKGEPSLLMVGRGEA